NARCFGVALSSPSPYAAAALIRSTASSVGSCDSRAWVQRRDDRVTPPPGAREAITQLQELGRVHWPDLSAAQQFSRAFTDPKNAELAKESASKAGAANFVCTAAVNEPAN